ncbi:MAG TPA: HEAT repeat domain-containing protein [Leptolyngbyaceae cyanobacterium]
MFGASGSGKSTLLSKLLLDAAVKARQGDTDLIPVLVELRSYEVTGESSGLQGLILEAIESHDPTLTENDVKQLRKQRRLLLLIDGFNEIPDEKAKRKIKEYCRHIQVIVTSRSSDDWREIERKLEIEPLSPGDVIHFFQEHSPDSSQSELEDLGARVRDFGKTPLMVWMLYSIFNANKDIPETRGEAYRKFTMLYTEQAKEGIDLSEARSLLSRLAFEMMQSSNSDDSRDFCLEIPELVAQSLLGSEKTLKLLHNCHLLTSYGKPGNRYIKFCHQSLQEYYAAEELLRIYQDKSSNRIDDSGLQHLYLNYLKWQESFTLLASLLTSEAQAVRLVEIASDVDLMLAARLTKELVLKFSDRLTAKLISIFLPENSKIGEWLKIELLGLTCSPSNLTFLSSFLTSSNSTLARRAAFWISKLPSNEIRSILLKTIRELEIWVPTGEHEPQFSRKLSHKNLELKTEAIFALSTLDKEEAAAQIRSIFQDQHSVFYFFEQPRLYKLLASIDSSFVYERAFEIIETAKGRESSNLLTQALISLSHLDENLDIDKIIARLNVVNDRIVREVLINGLGKFSQETAAQALVGLLRSSNLHERRKSSESIIKHHRTNTIPYLAEILDNLSVDWDIRLCAAIILGKFGDIRSVNTLIEALNSNDRSARIAATELLGSFERDDVISSLVLALQDSDYGVRRGAAVSLAYFGKEESVPELIKALWHYFPQEEVYLNHKIVYEYGDQAIPIHGMTYDALYSLGDDEAIQTWLFESHSVGAREQAAFALSQFNRPDVIQELDKALHLGLKAAAIPLAKIGLKDVMPVLIDLLEDIGSFSYSSQSIDALLNLVSVGNVEIIDWLVGMLEAISKQGMPQDVRFLNRLATVLASIEHEIMPSYLPRLVPLLASEIGEQVYWVVSAIQSQHGFFNYNMHEHAPTCSLEVENRRENKGKIVVNQEFNFDQRGATIGVNIANEGSTIKFVQQTKQTIDFSEQDLSEAANKIQALLNQLSKSYPTTTPNQQQAFIREFIARIESTPIPVKILLAGGIEGLKALFPVGIPIEMAKSLYEAIKRKFNQQID